MEGAAVHERGVCGRLGIRGSWLWTMAAMRGHATQRTHVCAYKTRVREEISFAHARRQNPFVEGDKGLRRGGLGSSVSDARDSSQTRTVSRGKPLGVAAIGKLQRVHRVVGAYLVPGNPRS